MPRHPSFPARDSMYDDVAILRPDGSLVRHANKKGARWYVRRGLAVAEGERAIRLGFWPSGKPPASDAVYGNGPRDGRCCVCGSREGLTGHHVVPRCVIRHLPRREDDPTQRLHLRMVDVVPLCGRCHGAYEAKADLRKAEIGRRPEEHERTAHHATGAARTILRHGERLPAEARARIQALVADHLGHPPSGEELARVATAPSRLHLTFVEAVEEADDLRAFVHSWRQHFVETMRPRFLPAGWLEAEPSDPRPPFSPSDSAR